MWTTKTTRCCTDELERTETETTLSVTKDKNADVDAGLYDAFRVARIFPFVSFNFVFLSASLPGGDVASWRNLINGVAMTCTGMNYVRGGGIADPFHDGETWKKVTARARNTNVS